MPRVVLHRAPRLWPIAPWGMHQQKSGCFNFFFSNREVAGGIHPPGCKWGCGSMKELDLPFLADLPPCLCNLSIYVPQRPINLERLFRTPTTFTENLIYFCNHGQGGHYWIRPFLGNWRCVESTSMICILLILLYVCLQVF